jgi:outer membrane receptor for ferric coprogen and ferric-rhodotorulic acid
MKIPTMNKTLRRLTALLPMLSLAAAAAAQTSPVKSSTAAADEVVALPEFSVTDSNSGWVATNALSGTRTNINLRDLPRSVQVLHE